MRESAQFDDLEAEGLYIRLFGSFHASLNGVPLPGLHRREGARLLAFLALRAGADVEYRTIATYFFPAEAQNVGGTIFVRGDYPSVRQAIFALRQALGEEAHRIISVGKGVVRLDLAGAKLDTLEFDRLSQGDAEEQKKALALYNGPLLSEWKDSWIEPSRAHYARGYARLHDALTHAGKAANKVFPYSEEKNADRDKLAHIISIDEVGGALSPDSAYYLEREADTELARALEEQCSVALLKGPRQVGKTSLLARELQRARTHGTKVAMTDLQMLQEDDLLHSERLTLALARILQRQLRHTTPPEEVWNDAWGANLNLEIYLEDVVLRDQATRLIWAIDEADRLFFSPCGNDLFGTFRSWHNRRALEPDSVWARLTLVIAYATEAHLFISDLNQSPFNIGRRLTLQDFTIAQVGELNARCGSPLQTTEELARLYMLLGGHPYLTQRGLAEIARGNSSLSQLEARADREEGGPFSEHLRRLRVAFSHDEAMREGVRTVLNGAPSGSGLTPGIFYRLRSGGVLVGDYPAEASLRCTLYEMYLRRILLS